MKSINKCCWSFCEAQLGVCQTTGHLSCHLTKPCLVEELAGEK